MVDDPAKPETVDEVFIVGGTHDTTSEVDDADVKQNVAQLLRKANTVTPQASRSAAHCRRSVKAI